MCQSSPALCVIVLMDHVHFDRFVDRHLILNSNLFVSRKSFEVFKYSHINKTSLSLASKFNGLNSFSYFGELGDSLLFKRHGKF